MNIQCDDIKGLKEAVIKYQETNPGFVSEAVELEADGKVFSGQIERLGDTVVFKLSVDLGNLAEKVKTKVKKVVAKVQAKKVVKKAAKKKK